MSFGYTSIRPASNGPSVPPRSAFSSSLNKAVVAAYRWLGFVVLGAILTGLVSYIVLNVVYFLDTGWIAPAIISPTDPRVLDLTSRLAHETFLKQQVEGTRADLESRVSKAKRVVAMEQGFQTDFRRAIEQDAAARRSTLGRLAALNEHYQNTKQDVERSSEAYVNISRERSQELYSAKLIDQDALVARSHELAELAHSNLSLREGEIDLQTKLSDLSREASALDVLAKNRGSASSKQALSYDALRIGHEFQQSVVAGRGALDDQAAAEQALVALDKAVVHYDKLVETLEKAALLRAASHRFNVAFVPYSNLYNVARGAPVYGCRLQVLICKRIGEVKELLEGEVTLKHPLWGTELRGQLVELQVDRPEAMQLPVLHVGRAPLFF